MWRKNFIWNATNLSLQIREKIFGLCEDYGARVHLQYVESAYEDLHRQNRERKSHQVPGVVLDKLMARWEIPDPWDDQTARANKRSPEYFDTER